MENNIPTLVGFAVNATAAIGIVAWGCWRETNITRKIKYYHKAFREGYNYCAGSLLRGQVLIHQLEAEADDWPGEPNQTARAFQHGMQQALEDWDRRTS